MSTYKHVQYIKRVDVGIDPYNDKICANRVVHIMQPVNKRKEKPNYGIRKNQTINGRHGKFKINRNRH